MLTNTSASLLSIIFRRPSRSLLYLDNCKLLLLSRDTSLSLVRITFIPSFIRSSFSFSDISRLISFSLKWSLKEAPPSTPPCPGSMTITRSFISVSDSLKYSCPYSSRADNNIIANATETTNDITRLMIDISASLPFNISLIIFTVDPLDAARIFFMKPQMIRRMRSILQSLVARL